MMTHVCCWESWRQLVDNLLLSLLALLLLLAALVLLALGSWLVSLCG